MGNVTVTFQGKMSSDGKTWGFAGTAVVQSEPFDFFGLWEEARSILDNAQNVAGGIFTLLTSAESFQVFITGFQNHNYHGNCP